MRKIKALWRLMFPPNDWITVKAYQATWNISSDFGDYKELAMYEILYSEYRNRFKIHAMGYKPHLHKMYPEVVNAQMYLITQMDKINKTQSAVDEVNEILNGKK